MFDDELDTDELVLDTDETTLLTEDIVEEDDTRLELLTLGALELAPGVSSAGAPPHPAKILDSINDVTSENLECLRVPFKNLMSSVPRCQLTNTFSSRQIKSLTDLRSVNNSSALHSPCICYRY